MGGGAFMKNYPLFTSRGWNFSPMDAWKYVNLYRHHKITSRRINSYSVSTLHTFPDRLVIQFTWNISDFNHTLSPFPTLNEMRRLYEQNLITLNTFAFQAFSSPESDIPSSESRAIFLNAFESQQRPLLREEYQMLEHHDHIQSFVTDDHLDTLVANYLKFAAYLKETGRM
jgi:hypothetical protein